MANFKNGIFLKITATRKLCTELKNNQYPINNKKGAYTESISTGPELT